MKSPFKKIVNLSPVKTVEEFACRDLSWYDAGARFLFIAKTDHELQKWLVVFAWLLNNK